MTISWKKHIPILILLLLCCSMDTAAKHSTIVPCLPDQASSLLQLKTSFINASLSSWRSETDCCHWEHVECDMSTGRVISLYLSEFLRKSLEPDLFSNLTSLKSLDLHTEGFSKGLSSISNLQSLSALGLYTWGLEKQELSWIGYLKQLASLTLVGYDFSQSEPSWIGNLTSLHSLRFQSCNFPGSIPYQIGRLAKLTSLDLGYCNCIGQLIPSWLGNLTKLAELDIQGAGGSCSGQIPSTMGNLTRLEIIQMTYNNNLTGKNPKSLFALPVLQTLSLGSNQLSGTLEDIPTPLSSALSFIDLSLNQITGPIPKSFFLLKRLQYLYLESNRLSGAIELRSLWNLKSLISLSLSNNMLSIIVNESDNVLPSLPSIISLNLASCNLTKLPGALRYSYQISDLDISNNQINGVIPSWMWENWKDQLQSLNLSNNMFTTLEESPSLIHLPNLNVLDISSNRLQGTVPIPVTSSNGFNYGVLFDYSNNSFSSIEPNFGKYITEVTYLNLSKNKIKNHIPSSICSASKLDIIDLSYNMFHGSIPSCLIETGKLSVLKLRENQFQGLLPQNIREGCALQTIDLSGNQIEGKLPRSLSNCQDLELFDVSNNQITDYFPSWLGSLPKLQILVLKSNQLNGTIEDINEDPSTRTHFTSLQILDLASNNFSGNLPKRWFGQLKAMMTTDNENGQVIEYYLNSTKEFYQDTITITLKGADRILTKILMAVKVIDFSNNSFDGPIPESLGWLFSLYELNMSYNNFTGQIPHQLSSLSQLESLDLSSNQLSGEIPWELTSLTALGWLNISHSNLTGRIPQGNQFSTFPESSFEDNAGLCGIPLSKPCEDQGSIAPTVDDPSDPNNMWQDKLGVIVLFALVGLGFGVGFALSFLLRLFCHVEWWICKYP